MQPSYGAASEALIAIGGALYERENRGRGQRVETSIYDGALAVVASFGAFWNEKGLTAFGAPAPGSVGGIPSNRRLLLRMYECADGEYLQFHTGAP